MEAVFEGSLHSLSPGLRSCWAACNPSPAPTYQLDLVVHICSPVLGSQRQEDPSNSLANQAAEVMNSRFSWKKRAVEEGTGHWARVHTHVHRIHAPPPHYHVLIPSPLLPYLWRRVCARMCVQRGGDWLRSARGESAVEGPFLLPVLVLGTMSQVLGFFPPFSEGL